MLNLGAGTLKDAIAEILGHVAKLHAHEPSDAILEAVLHRESQGSTAMAGGLALPHARVPGLHGFYLFFAVPAQPLEDKGLDGRPVDVVVLILANDQKNTLMLQTMAAIGKIATVEGGMDRLRSAASPEALWQAVDATDVLVREGLFARDLMRDAPIIAHRDMLLRDLLDRLFESKEDEAPVCDDKGALVGVVTSEEIIEAGFPDYMSRMRDISFLNEFEAFEQFFKREATTKVGDILNPDPLVVEIETPLIQVVFLMKRERQRFAFVEEDGRFAGIVDRDDIISRILRV
jgi:nitrogen PTS system EIIA component